MNDKEALRPLTINFEELANAMEDHGGYGAYYLDLQSGEMIMLPEELQHRDLDDEELAESLPAWEQEFLSLAREIQAGSDRYEPVPQVPSREIYNLMVEFAESVAEPHLRELLAVALQGKGAFGRFKGVLYDRPAEQERWFELKRTTMEAMVREWLAELGIEPVARSAGSPA